MDLKGIMLNEMKLIEKYKCRVVSLICGISEEMHTNEQNETNRPIDRAGGCQREGVGEWEGGKTRIYL